MNEQNDDFRTMVQAAAKAPSGHNTQPWLFGIKDNYITIYPDMSESLPVVDPDNRELYISLGAAIKNLCLEASRLGYESVVAIDKVENKITIELIRSYNLNINTLSNYIDKRQSNKQVYNYQTISSDKIEILKNTPLSQSTNLYIISREEPLFAELREYIRKGNEIQMNDKDFKDELIDFMRFNKKEIKKKPSGLAYYIIGSPALPRCIAKPIVKSFLNPSAQNKSDLKKIDSSSHLALFTIKKNTIEEWINVGQDLQHFLLETSNLGISNAYMNQPCEVAELATNMQKHISLINNEYPVLLLRIGYTDTTAPYSPRKSIESIIIS